MPSNRFRQCKSNAKIWPLATSQPSKELQTQTKDPFRCNDATWNNYVAAIGTQFLLRPWVDESLVLDETGYGKITPILSSEDSLQNDIHPLFAPDRFPLEDFTSVNGSRLWIDLQPALRLASRMLVSAPVRTFLHKVKFGRKVTDKATCRTYLMNDLGMSIDEGNAAVMQDLIQLSRKLHLIFAAIKHDSAKEDSQCHGIHYVSQKEFGSRVFLRDARGLPEDSGEHHYITLNQAYREYFTSSQERTPMRDTQTQCLVASTLIHEVCGHAYYARDRTDKNEEYVEPFFHLDQCDDHPELGCALDYLLYGTQLSAIIDPIRGGYFEHWPILAARKGKHIIHVDSHVIFPVSPPWLQSWLSESAWQRIEEAPLDVQMKAFNIPDSDYAAVKPNLESSSYSWRPRKKMLPKGSRKRYVEQYEKKDRDALQAALGAGRRTRS
jgi:hypothetical protein